MLEDKAHRKIVAALQGKKATTVLDFPSCCSALAIIDRIGKN